MTDFIQQFISAMKAAGCAPEHDSDIVADDKRHNYQIEGDKPGKKAGGYGLNIQGDFAYGWFVNNRDGEIHKWHSKSDKKFSDAEKIEWKRKRDEAKKSQELHTVQRQNAAAIEAAKVWAIADEFIVDHPYLTRKGVQAYNIRAHGSDLLIPMMDRDGLWAYQRIDSDGGKWYLPEARKKGCYCPLTAPEDRTDRLIICEGYATGASIREAFPDVPVYVAFDAGNLLPVAQSLREQFPAYRIIVAGDSDQWTWEAKARAREGKDFKPHEIPGDDPRWAQWFTSGLLVNVGIDKARAAAGAVEAYMIYPDFPKDDKSKRTDFNDQHATDGLDAVRDRIRAVMHDEAPARILEVPPPDVQPGGGDIPPPDYDDRPDLNEAEEFDGDLELPFRVLGYNEGEYFYYSFHQKQIIRLNAGAHSINNLLQLATINQWEAHYEKVPLNKIPVLAFDAMLQKAQARGVFQEEDRVRGVGAWTDAGRVILHCGDVVYVDGVETDMRKIKGHYTYIASSKLFRPAAEQLSNADARQLRTICETVTWENRLSGSLLAGWLVVAQVCPILKWRPHIWITGQADSGKSTVVEKIVRAALGRIALNVDGGTSEPAIRQLNGYAGRPLVYDEAENEADPRIMRGVISLARKASSGSTVAKFGQRPFKAQFSACFSAINPPIKDFADESRISLLVIKKNTKPTSQADYYALLAMIDGLITPDFSNRMLARTLNNIQALLKNIETFKRAARTVLKASRASDQIAPMLAGLYLLGRTDIIDDENAERWIREQDWSYHTAINEDADPVRCIQHIAGAIVRYTPSTGNSRDVTLGNLIVAAIGRDETINREWADRTLRMHGIVSRADGVSIANRSQNLGKILSDTVWSNGDSGWNRTLSDVPGAAKVDKLYLTPGNTHRAVKIPLAFFTEMEQQQDMQFEEEIPF